MTAAPPISLADRARLRLTFVIEAALSFAASLLFVGIFFYTSTQLRWGVIENFALAAAQGLVYVVGALAAQPLAHRLGRRGSLVGSNVALAAVSLLGVLSNQPAVLTFVMIAYCPLMALNWPVLESAAAAGADPHTMSRRIGMYNLIWAGTAALAVAVQGTMIKVDPRLVFGVPLIVHGGIVLLLLVRGRGFSEDTVAEATPPAHAHLEPEPALVRQRTLALWLSRIAMPSTYVVIYSLSALMPLIPEVKALPPAEQTLVGSVWLVTRWLTFGVLGATLFWHTRPMLLLGAAFVMAAAFVGSVAPIGLPAMIASQAVLGAAIGVIYTASLYFGMVLSDGSAEHAGYHEALIGLGQVLGPGVGALAQWVWPGSLGAGVAAVSILTALSLVAASVAAAKARRQG